MDASHSSHTSGNKRKFILSLIGVDLSQDSSRLPQRVHMSSFVNTEQKEVRNEDLDQWEHRAGGLWQSGGDSALGF